MDKNRRTSDSEIAAEFEARSLKALALYGNGFAGYAGFSWYVPGAQICLKNVRLRPHPERERCWLLDPAPEGTEDEEWTLIRFDTNAGGTGLFTRTGFSIESDWDESRDARLIQRSRA